MAEVLGVVASGIAISQVADQIVKRIHDLHKFWQSVRDAPKDIGDALEEIEILGDTLLELQTGMKGLRRSAATDKCLKHCRIASQNLATIIESLQQSLEDSKTKHTWAAVKAALRKGQIQELQQRLDRARSLLTLAINCYSISTMKSTNQQVMFLQESITILQEQQIGKLPPSMISECPVESPGVTRASNKKSSIIASSCVQSTRSSFFGHYQYREWTTGARWRQDTSTSDNAKNEDDRTIEWKFRPATWLRLPAASIQAKKAWGNWQYSFRPIRVVPFKSPIWYCRKIDDVLNLFKNGSATIYDVDPQGWTLLHIAAFHQAPKLAKWLIEQGADCDAVDDELNSCLHIATQYRHSRLYLRPDINNYSDLFEVTKILVEIGQVDPMLLNARARSVLHESPDLQTYRYLTQSQQSFCVDLQQFDGQVNSILQTYGESPEEDASIVIRYMLGNDLNISMLGTETSKYGSSFLRSAVRRLTSLYMCNWNAVFEIEMAWILDLINAGVNVHSVEATGYTYLDTILSHCYDIFEYSKEILLLTWLKCLSIGGVNLHEYLKREERLHNDNIIEQLYYHKPHILRTFIVYYGASSDDITLLVEDSRREVGLETQLPSSWDEAVEYAETRGLILLEGAEPKAKWSVSTAGFKDGDYSASRAGSDENLRNEEFLARWSMRALTNIPR